MQRIISLQPSLQGDAYPRFFQSLFLLELVDSKAEELAATTPYDGLFRNAIGCTVVDYSGLLLGLYAQSAVESMFNLEVLFSTSPRATELKRLATTIFALQGCAQEDVGRLLDTDFSRHRAEGLVQAFFTQRPFVRIDESRYLLPLHPFMRLLSVSGPVFRALEFARLDAEARGQSEPWTNEHSSRMGKRFEDLISTLIGENIAPGHWEPEYEYQRGAKSPDFILFEASGTVVLIQAKLKRMTPGAFFGYDLEEFKSDADRFAETLWRSIRYLRNIKRMRQRGKPLDPVSQRVLASKRVVLVGIMPFLSPVFVPGLPREVIKAAVRAQLREEDRALFDFDSVAGWHIMGFDDLSVFFSLQSTGTLGQTIVDYVSDMGDTFIDDSGFVPSFRNWCIRRYGPGINPPASWKRAYDLIWAHGKRLLFH